MKRVEEQTEAKTAPEKPLNPIYNKAGSPLCLFYTLTTTTWGQADRVGGRAEAYGCRQVVFIVLAGFPGHSVPGRTSCLANGQNKQGLKEISQPVSI